MVIALLLIIPVILWIISLSWLYKWTYFWRFFLINVGVLIGYMFWLTNSELHFLGHDEYGLARMGLIGSLVLGHTILGFVFAIFKRNQLMRSSSTNMMNHLKTTVHQPYQEHFNRPADFVVHYRFLTKAEGGRRSTPFQGYRSDFWYAHEHQKPNQLYMIWPEFLNESGKVITTKDQAVPEIGYAQMWIINDYMRALHKDHITEGLTGFFMEGKTRVAECSVTKIVGL